MRLNVLHILQQPLGHRESFTIQDEHPTLSDITLTQPLEGELIAVRVDGGIDVEIRLHAYIELECHRCLQSFEHEVKARATAPFRDKPGEDEWPIERTHEISLDEPIRQEILVRVPVKQLCSQDCAGIALTGSQ